MSSDFRKGKDNQLEETTPLYRKNILLTHFRGDAFLINLHTLCNSPEVMRNVQVLRQRNNEVRDAVSYRTLNHWDSLDLIQCERDSGKGWRRFNAKEALWVSVIRKFRDLGVSHEKIRRCKPYFFEEIHPSCTVDYVEYYIIGALYCQKPTFFLTLPDGQSEFMTYEEMNSAMHCEWLNEYICVHLNPLLNQIFHKIEIKSKFPLERSVSDEQYKLCDIMEDQDFDSMEVVKDKGEISRVNTKKTFPSNVTAHELQKDYLNVTIISKKIKGRPDSRTRIIHNNLKDKS